MPAPVPPFKRLLAGYRVSEESGCWEWRGHTYSNGYGAIKVFGRMLTAHRYSYELHKGPIPYGLQVLHSCDNKRCINPDHLRLGTHQENMIEASERGRMRAGKDHPQYGKRCALERKLKISKPVWVLGKPYPSQKQAERELGLGAGTVRWWTINKPHKARRLTVQEFLECSTSARSSETSEEIQRSGQRKAA